MVGTKYLLRLEVSWTQVNNDFPMETFLRYQKTLAIGQEPIDWNFFNNRFLETFSSLLTLMAAVPDLQLQRLTPQKATTFGQ